ncbi:MAG: DegV family protein [Candidatus Dormibacteraeota bacterium]|nr:DegV family protein [Candidatus Dormibacteraeota bacterium]MBV9525154.1 DegV family protein [Candidatus Dormibacteraeota bacterium]
MARVRIVCDSTADLEPGFRRAHDVRVVPLKVIFGDEVLEDGETIRPDEFYRRMRESPVHPRTSQPAPGEFETVFRDLTADGSAVLCTTISAELSGTYASAEQARAALPDADIRVIDTRTVAVAHNAMVHAAVAAAEAGGGADEAEAAVRRLIADLLVLFTVDTLEYLRRGGRIGGARALVGSVLDIKPILEIRDGRIEPVDRARTLARALDRMVGDVGKAAARWGGADVVVGHGDRPDEAARLAERIRPLAGAGSVKVIDVGPVIGCHAGPGVFGLGFAPLAPGSPAA